MLMPNANAALSETVPGSKRIYSWKKNEKRLIGCFPPTQLRKRLGKTYTVIYQRSSEKHWALCSFLHRGEGSVTFLSKRKSQESI